MILPTKPLLTIQEAAEILGVSTKTLRRWDESGVFKPEIRTDGNQRRYSVDQVAQFERNSVGAGSSRPNPITIGADMISNGARGLDGARQPRPYTPITVLSLLTILLSNSILISNAKHEDWVRLKAQASSLKSQIANTTSGLRATPSYVGGGKGGGIARGQGAVLAAETTLNDFVFNVNVPTNFANQVKFSEAVEFLGDITATNIVYGLVGGTGITIGAGQNPTITNSDRGTSQNIFKTIKVGDTTFAAGSNTDTLTFAAGSGIAVGINTSDKKLTISNSLNLDDVGWKDNGSYVGLVTLGDNVSIGTATGAAKLAVEAATGDIFTASGAGTLRFKIANNGNITVGGVAYTFPSAQATTSSQVLTNDGTGTLRWGNVLANDVAADTLDFEHFKDAMTLDAATSIANAGYTLTVSGTGAVAFSNTGAFSIAGATTLTNSFSQTGANTFSTGTGAVSLNGDTTLGDAVTDNITFTGRVAQDSDLIPLTTTGTNDLGASALPWDNLYVNNIYGPSSGVSGYLQRASGSIAPTNITDDIIIGSTATTSANLILSGTTGAITTSLASFNLINTNATTLNIGGAATTLSLGASTGTTTVNNALTVTGTTTLNGIANIGDGGDAITLNGTAITQTVSDNIANAVDIQEGSNNYININTTNASENIAFGNASTNPSFSFLGSGATTFAGNVSQSGSTTFSTGTGAVSLNGDTTVANAKSLTANGAFTLGDNGDTGSIDTSDWNINTTGDLTGIGAVTMDGNFSQTGSTTFSTGTGLFSANGALTVAGTLTANGIFVLGDNGDVGSIDTSDWNINTTGDLTGIGAITADGAISTTSTLGITGLSTLSGGQITSGARTGLALAIFNETGDQDILTASASGAHKFSVERDGDLVLEGSTNDGFETTITAVDPTADRTITIPNDTGTVCLSSGNCAGGSGGTKWQVNSGVVAPLAITNDLAIGGIATSSALFQISGTTGNASSAGTLTFSTSPTIASTAKQSLTLGDSNTGDIVIAGTTLRTANFRLTTTPGSGYILVSDASGNGTWTDLTTSANLGPWSLTGSVLYPDLASYDLLFGSATTTDSIGKLTVSGAKTGKALTVLNETGDQNILVASASGTGVVTLDRSGNLAIEGTISDLGGATLIVADDLQINEGDLLTDDTTFNLINTTATTLNIGGAATTLSVGASTGTTTVNNTLAITGPLTANGNVTLGDAITDTITFTGRVTQDADLLPITATGTNDLGSSLLPWDNIYVTNANVNDLVANTTTANIVNTTATTVNFAGAATTLSVGASSGTTTINNALTVTGTLTANGAVNIGDAGDAITLAGSTLTANMVDNTANSLDIQQGADNYINISTVNAAENISFGNASINPSFSFLGTGTSTFAGNISQTGTTTFSTGTGAISLNGDTTIAADKSFYLAAGTGKLGVGTTTPDGKLHVTGAVVGKALGIFNETGDQNILAASASGTTKFTLDRSGNLKLAAGGSVDVLAAGGLTLGSSTATAITITTDSTGDAEVVLPTGSIGSGEILDNDLTTSDLNAALTFSALDFIDLASVIHNTTALQGLRLPQIGTSPSSPTSGEGFVGWDETNNALKVYNGTAWVSAGGTSQTVISPEYPGAIISADGSNNVGTLTSDREATGSGNLYSINYYEFSSGQSSIQDYDVYVRWEVPENWTGWATSNALTIDYATEDTSSANNQLDVQITKEGDADTVTSSDNVSPTASKWQSQILASSPVTFTAAQLNTGITWAAGDVMIIRLRLHSKDNYYTRVGPIKFDW